jgi:hypothetical protein
VTVSEWTNFGANRTASFQAARDYLSMAGWDLATTYGLLLDADMVFHPGTLRTHPLGGLGYSILQQAGGLKYPNCRLIRMDHPWTCKGVTHEYWDGTTTTLPESVCWIEDRNDGGCKSDKFERDVRLLEAGLLEEPENVRYMFYLAQTYHSLGRWEDSIALYTKRFEAGGWDEERWYSLYMMGDAYLKLKQPLKFEMAMQQAMAMRPGRAEAAYALTKYFRETGDHYKAWYYLLRGRSIPLSTDSLFVEPAVYTSRFAYEATILLYYIGKHQEGLRESMTYLLTKTETLDSVYTNMAFYVKPLGTAITNHPVPRDAAGHDFHPSSVSIVGDLQNVRFVNYAIDTRTGSYSMKDGGYSPDHTVRTRNVLWDGTTATLLDESETGLPLVPHRIEGLEDVRVYVDSMGVRRFVASCAQVGPSIRVVQGDYVLTPPSLRRCTVLQPPTETSCEKNWLPIPSTDSILYSWHPFQVGTVRDSALVIQATYPTPWFFKHLRGSAVPIRMGSELWALVHYVEYSMPRKYFHCIVALDGDDYRPRRITLPFTFKATGIEYCLGWSVKDASLTFVFSSWDDNPCMTTARTSRFEWIPL